ncbi:LysM peptidoglycan-binding domain-containing protein [Streptococcus sp. zg-86]|uniref:LysM peptidoglycan-binding domain-containing protein n=1 Tax=Streptococcus zhangguiae TaxID=2664091 RepID=A0A6I4RJV6_9STRE|nr:MULTISPECIES: LysM domain-containing protein [unclassified Streptococcus]MTB64866.1 LysM peptidoglycan-binding domain-containing protein [Streptococcus sp. zg-86]MTB91064.1 LysM peptidoglycan-binding domain-containing protein [Streptococcus sp. zg-36]MWV56853.1 LysM peptidoglycan-binding domain-containing protein [Streptococcus sp. zg-70]QTH48342.1 LysM peptidoglycan-binding domain-containing protein [Streptococcus sp. zg-86]
MSLNVTKKTMLFSTLALSLFTATTQADELTEQWIPRSVEEIQRDMFSQANKQTYTIQYGDTLSAIAEALNIDMTVLANINKIANINLIFPETVLTVTTGPQEEVSTIEIQTPQTDKDEEQVTAKVDLEKNEVVVNDQIVPVQDLTDQVDSPEAPVSPNAEEDSHQTQEAEATPNPQSAPATVEMNQAEAPAETTVAEENPVVTEAPVETSSAPTPAPVQPQSAPTSALADFAAIGAANPANAGLQPQTAAFKEEVASIYGLSAFSLYRPGDSGDHGKGLAVDFMVGNNEALGDQVANYSIQNIASKNISYIIWKQRFYAPYPNIYGPANTWNLMPDRGSVTENHFDHVHVSMNP